VKAKRIRLGLVIFLSLVSLSGCTLDNIAAQQEEATGLWGELTEGETFGQSFKCPRDNLHRIDLGTATYARTNSAPVIFHLRSSPEVNTDTISITLPGPEIQNERPTSITFSPLTDSQGKAYYLYIESPEAMPGNAITVYANAYDRYPDGTAYRNGRPVDGDLVFTAYSQETYTLASVWRDFMSRVWQDIPFFVCYGGLLLVVVLALMSTLYVKLHTTREAAEEE